MIDLFSMSESIRESISASIIDFSSKYPDERISSMGLYICPWAGWFNINFDTQENSIEYVESNKKRGRRWFGNDYRGQYCNNCPDFKYPDFLLINFEEWVSEIESSDLLKVKISEIEIIEIDLSLEGDEGLNKLFYEYFVNHLNHNHLFYRSLILNNKDYTRFGVQMLDSEYCQFFIV